MPPTEPFLRAAARALERDPTAEFRLEMSDFSPRGRSMFLPADQRSQRSSSAMSISSNSTSEGDAPLEDGARLEDDTSEDEDTSSVGPESDLGEEPREEETTIGGAVVVPPASSVIDYIDVEACLPRSAVMPVQGPYVVQVELPRDYVTAGVDIRTRVRVTVRLRYDFPYLVLVLHFS